MATLADLFASSQAPNAQTQLLAPTVAFQRPGGFNKTFGTIMDVLAAMGGKAPGYSTGIASRENAYNQSMEKQQFQNVFRNFVQNPDDPLVQANLAEVNPDAFLKVAPQNRLTPQGGVVRMGPLGSVETIQANPRVPGELEKAAQILADPNAPPQLKALVQAKYPPPQERLVPTSEGYLPESEAKGKMPFRAGSGGGGSGGGSGGRGAGGAPGKPAKALTPNQQQKVEAQNASRTQATTLVNKLAGLYRRLEGLGAAPGSAKTTGGNVRARVMASGVGQLVGQARGTNSQAIINEIEATKALLLPFYAQALGLTSKQFDTPAEREQLLQAFGAVTGRTDANISSLGSVAEAFGGKVSDPGQGAFKVRSRRPAGGQ